MNLFVRQLIVFTVWYIYTFIYTDLYNECRADNFRNNRNNLQPVRAFISNNNIIKYYLLQNCVTLKRGRKNNQRWIVSYFYPSQQYLYKSFSLLFINI